MTSIYEDPAEFTADAVRGYVDANSTLVRQVTGGVVRRRKPTEPKVAVIVGGGSGHYPAFMGTVGPGFADGAVVGNIFTSPSTAQAYSVGNAASSGKGVIFTYGNYAGDVMNFGLAGKQLEAAGIPARQMIVTDDIASADEFEKRRGIAGDFMVFKTLSAAAEAGLELDEVMRVGEKTNERTFTLGIAFSGCTFPGASEPLFTVPKGQMGLGLGIHGEPGLKDIPIVRASEMAKLLVDNLLEKRPEGTGNRIAVILNGLGATKYEELFVLWSYVAPLLRDAGLEIVAPEVGELVTSLDMGGVSLTLTWLDDELEEYWLAPCLTPAFRRGNAADEVGGEILGDDDAFEDGTAVTITPGDAASQAAAATVLRMLGAARDAIHDAEEDLGKLDAIAGDGDHGRGMVRGLDFAMKAAESAAEQGAGAAGLLGAAGDAWAEFAGGTSGVLWGAGLRSLGAVLGDAGTPSDGTVVEAWQAWLDTLKGLGKAELGDKTLLDAAGPFVDAPGQGINEGLTAAWEAAVEVADGAAQATADLSPRVGRARPLAEKSLGHPDPGAISFVLCVRAAGKVLA